MNFSRSFALKCAFVGLAVAIVGCGKRDGVAELAEGQAAYEVSDLRRAERAFSKCLEFAPNNVDAIVYMARVQLDLGEITNAIRWISKAVELAGNDSDVRIMDAQIAWHAKDYAKAEERFVELANDQLLDASIRAQGWAGVGVVEMSCDNYHLARIAFLRAMNLDRHNASARYHLGLIYRNPFGYLEAALEQFEIFVRLETEADPRVQNVQRTIIPELKRDIADDLANRHGMSKRDSAASATALAKAEVAWKKGDFKTARQRYQEAANADALSYPAAVGLAKAYLKTDATKAGRTKAFDSYRRACVIRSGAINTFISAGALATQLGMNGQAVEIYSRAIAASPTSIEALDGLIASLRKVGGKNKVAQAYQEYRSSLRTNKRR